MKACSICGAIKPLADFYNQKQKDGTFRKFGACKLCSITQKRDWRVNNIARFREKQKLPKNKKLAVERARRYSLRHPEKRHKSQIRCMRNLRKTLGLCYLRKLLSAMGGVPANAITRRMAEIERDLVLYQRIKKEVLSGIT